MAVEVVLSGPCRELWQESGRPELHPDLPIDPRWCGVDEDTWVGPSWDVVSITEPMPRGNPAEEWWHDYDWEDCYFPPVAMTDAQAEIYNTLRNDGLSVADAQVAVLSFR